MFNHLLAAHVPQLLSKVARRLALAQTMQSQQGLFPPKFCPRCPPSCSAKSRDDLPWHGPLQVNRVSPSSFILVFLTLILEHESRQDTKGNIRCVSMQTSAGLA